MKVLVIGGTGYLGSQIAQQVQSNGHTLYALVRKGSNTDTLQKTGATIIEGDLTDEGSLVKAFNGMDVVISTAIGYNNRKPEDSIATVDDAGNQNLGNAIKKSGVPKLIFMSVLKSDIAQSVPHFKQKHLSEQYFEKIGISFISLRPGGFLDQVLGWNIDTIKNGQLPVVMNPEAPFTLILSEDIAKIAVQSIDIEASGNLVIDLGMTHPTTFNEVAKEISSQMGKSLKVMQYPTPDGEMGHTLNFIGSGQYIADTTLQKDYFGEPSDLQTSIKTWIKNVQLN
jgi:uncharacterized protein YbjT (DUF2867 family)